MPLQASGSIKLNGKRLSAKDGLSCNTVNDIIQDRDGFIWLGTPNGVSRYDGYQFINFTNLSKNSGQKTPHSIWLSKIGKDSGCKNEKTIAKGSLASMQGNLFLCKSLKILPACLVCLNLFLYFCKE